MTNTDLRTDLRTVCAELIDLLLSRLTVDKHGKDFRAIDLISRAQAILDAAVQGPTDEQLLAATRHLYSNDVAANMGAADDLITSRAILAAFGNTVIIREAVQGPYCERREPGYNPYLAPTVG